MAEVLQARYVLLQSIRSAKVIINENSRDIFYDPMAPKLLYVS